MPLTCKNGVWCHPDITEKFLDFENLPTAIGEMIHFTIKPQTDRAGISDVELVLP
jgi:hypothetical protein